MAGVGKKKGILGGMRSLSRLLTHSRSLMVYKVGSTWLVLTSQKPSNRLDGFWVEFLSLSLLYPTRDDTWLARVL